MGSREANDDEWAPRHRWRMQRESCGACLLLSSKVLIEATDSLVLYYCEVVVRCVSRCNRRRVFCCLWPVLQLRAFWKLVGHGNVTQACDVQYTI